MPDTEDLKQELTQEELEAQFVEYLRALVPTLAQVIEHYTGWEETQLLAAFWSQTLVNNIGKDTQEPWLFQCACGEFPLADLEDYFAEAKGTDAGDIPVPGVQGDSGDTAVSGSVVLGEEAPGPEQEDGEG